MFNKKTVLVLGAGASRPYGYPTSGELKAILLGGANANEVLGEVLKVPAGRAVEIARELEEEYSKQIPRVEVQRDLKLFRNTFRSSDRVSVDTFIASRPPDERDTIGYIAARAVAAVILACEENSKRLLFGNWYQWLLEFLLRNGRDFPSDLITLVTFNYDRSVEYYLWRCFLHTYRLDPTEAQTLLGRIKFVHVYGAVGPATFDIVAGNDVPFGGTSQSGWASKTVYLAGVRADEDAIRHVRRAIDEAEQIVFLGFGFWRENFNLLHTTEDGKPADWASKKVLASRYHLDLSTQIEVNGQVSLGSPDAKIEWGDPNHDLNRFVRSFNPNR